MKKILFCTLLISLLSGCSNKIDKPNYDQYLYEITDQDGHKDYLFGSSHVGDSRIYTITPKLEEVLLNIDSLVLEVNPMELELKMTYDSTYATDNPADLYASEEILKLFNEDSYGIKFDTSMYNAMTINALALLQFGHEVPFVALGGTGVTGMDRFLAKEAQKNNVPIKEIEGVEKQFNMIKELSKIAPNYFLEATMDTDKIKEDAKLILEAYENANKDTLYALLSDYESDRYSEEAELAKKYLLTDRNHLFYEYLASHLLNDQTELIAVGAVHIYGDDGLMARLKDSGYSVRCLEQD